MIQLKYYTDDYNTLFFIKLQTEIQLSINHIMSDIIIDLIMSDENDLSNEKIRNCIKN